MKRFTFLFLLILFPLYLSGESDRELARLYTEEAFYYYDRENYQLSGDYLEKAMEFSSELPESLYLAGLLREEQGDRLKAMEHYGKSIALTEVYSDYYYDLYFRYLNLLNITAHHKDVLSFFEDNREVFEKDNEILLKVADSAYRYGLVDYSMELASEVYSRNPFNLKSLLYLRRLNKRSDYEEKIRQALYNLQSDQLDEVIFQYLILNSEEPEKGELVVLYKDIFGETEFYFLQEDRKNKAIGESRNLMIRSYGSSVLDDGVYFGDYNFDGISDEIVSVIGDELTYLKDGNQDNVTDLSVNFVDGNPVNIFLNLNGIGYEFVYSDYPYLKSIKFFNNGQKRDYSVYPGTDFTPLNALESFDWKYNENRTVLDENFSLPETDLMEMSYLMKEYYPYSDDVYREYSIMNGEIRGIRERTGQTGDYNYFLDIKVWIPEAGRLDLNNDGFVDIYEYYEDGKIHGIAIDWNNNGKPEYIEDWSVINVKSWDFNEDTYPDAEYIHSGTGETFFSTPYEKEDTELFQLYSWDFSYENFWFNNN